MAITQKNLPPQGAAVPVYENDPYPGITAKPLQSPDFVNIKPKNPLLSLRWCNRVAGEGQRLDQVTYAGFRPVKADEVYIPSSKGPIPCPESMVRDGKVLYGDLILMAIPKVDYEGALKNNWLRAVNRMNPNSAMSTGKDQLSKTMKEAGVPTSALKDKLSLFQPSTKDIETGEKASQ
jgi:hypothetical protein